MARDISLTATSTGVGPVSLDVEMARKHGWSEALINKVAFAIGAISRQANYETSFAKGYTYKCLVCECWTVQPPASCHLCHQDGERTFHAAATFGNVSICRSCGREKSLHYGGLEYRCDPVPRNA